MDNDITMQWLPRSGKFVNKANAPGFNKVVKCLRVVLCEKSTKKEQEKKREVAEM